MQAIQDDIKLYFRATWTVEKPGPYPVDVRYHGNSILVPVPTVQFL